MITLKHRRATAAILTAANPTLAAGEFAVESDTGRIKIGNGSTAWASLGYFVPSASDISAGTLPDARLSSNVPLLANLAGWASQPSTAIETFPRSSLAFSGPALVSGQVMFGFFTPLVTTTVSQISMSVVSTAASGLTLARMGLFAFDESTATLVARTASDTTLFTATRTVYTRVFNTTGGYPATYTLVAGTRYGVGVIAVGTTMPVLSGTTPPFEIATLAPKLSAARGSQSDLATVGSLGTTSSVPYARLS
jgi:hypothetical protein